MHKIEIWKRKILNFMSTTTHKAWVAKYIIMACGTLLRRAIVHDFSRYSKQEAPYFEKVLPKTKTRVYGSSEYQAALDSLAPALDNHYKNNSHHPQYYGAIDLMSPLDQIEMLCDWMAAGKRYKDGSMEKSLVSNRERFKADSSFHDALERDAEEIGLLNG